MITDDGNNPPPSDSPGSGGGKMGRILTLVPKRPPPGRPSGAVTVAELAEQITRDVRSAMSAETEQRHGALRAELAADVKTATSLAIAAIVMNAFAIVSSLAFSRVLAARGLGLALAGLTAVFFAVAKLGAGARRGSSAR